MDMFPAKATPERLNAFSDGVFAVLITILVLDLRPPGSPTLHSLLLLWPTWLSYSVSYIFIAIVWANHHHLLGYATEATPRLMWFNFGHLFSVFAPATLDRMDGSERIGTPAGRLLCSRVPLRKPDLHLLDLGADRQSARTNGFAICAKDYAHPVDFDASLVQRCRGCSITIPLGWARNLLLLPRCLLET
jgi:hypothetical protein